MSLMFSVSGLRGIVGKDLSTKIISKYARVFGKFVEPGKVIIGRDARKSGKLFREAVIKGLHAAGCSVIDLGIVPTPTVLFMVRALRARGGIVITASHNPSQWNALKFITKRGQFLEHGEFERFSKYIAQDSILTEKPKKIQKANIFSKAMENHIKKITTVFRSSRKKFKVGVDAVNGAGSIALPQLLEKMGCKVYRLNCTFSPTFPRKPEPTKENITSFCKLVKKNKLDLGFAVDPDCDRLSIVDENGRAIGEEKTLVLATDYILSQTRGNVVTNLSTSTLMEYVVRKFGCRLYRTKVGEANVVSKMQKVNAIIGGEGNGGVIYPRINFTRDALVAAAIILTLLTEQNKTISKICAQYPKYYMIKKKTRMPKERFVEKKEKIIGAFEGKTNFLDGLKIIGRNYWLHIRPSQTEPLIRIIGEARDKKKIKQYIRKVETILK